MPNIEVTDSDRPIGEWIRAVRRGEEVVFTEHSEPIAKLISIESNRPTPRFGSAKGMIRISSDFDASSF